MVILNVLFSWLVQAGYLAGNPLALSRQRTPKAAPRITRYLEPGLWQEVKDFIASMPQETARDRAHYHRVRWLFTLLYLGGLRIAEVGGNTMGQFFVRRDRDGTMRWWLTVQGKGAAGAGDARADDGTVALPAVPRHDSPALTQRGHATRPANR